MTKSKLLFVLQAVTLLAFVASLLALTAIPTSILLPGNIPYAKRPRDVGDAFQLPSALGGARIERAPWLGCIVVHPPHGPSGEPLCNWHLNCRHDGVSSHATMFIEVLELNDHDAFAARVASECDSACCDYRATSFTGGGRRLDDDLRHRLWLRLGYFGAALACVGALFLARATRPGTSLLWRVVGIALFAVCTVHLWLNE